MLTKTKTIFLGRDNPLSLALAVDLTPVKHNSITRCQVKVGDILLDSQTSPGLFDFTDISRLTLRFGSAPLFVGVYNATLVVFFVDQPNGVVWGEFKLVVK